MRNYLSIILVLALFSCQKLSSKKEKEVTETQSTISQVPAVEKEFTPPTELQADTIWVDIQQSQIEWIGRKITGEHFGTLSLEEGWITMNDSTLIGGKFIFDMNSIKNTDIESPDWSLKLDNHLKSSDFFNVDSFPQAILKIKKNHSMSEENNFEGQVKELIYLGDHIRVRLAVGTNENFIVKIPNEGNVNFQEKDKVKISWLAEDIRALDLTNTNN